jgi:hypothetical protein
VQKKFLVAVGLLTLVAVTGLPAAWAKNAPQSAVPGGCMFGVPATITLCVIEKLY